MSTNPRTVDPLPSPDQNAAGLLTSAPDPLRYDGHMLNPDEVSGIVASMIPTGARVLDIGCGTGSLGQILSDARHAQVVGIEPDSIRAQRAIERGMQVHVGYLTPGLTREIGLFDAVLFTDVLEHLPNPHPLLVLSREVLKPNGAVIVSVPNVAHWSVRLDLLRGNFRYQAWGIMDATHLRWFTAASAEALLTAAGFKVVEYRATAGYQLFDNIFRGPVSWLPASYRARLLRVGSKRWPTLFGAQHVLKAEAR